MRRIRERVRRRAFPLIASVGLIVVGMYTTTWGPTMLGRTEWALPYDLWGTLIATTRLAHGNIGGIYAPPTGLISLPGRGGHPGALRGADLGARPVPRHPGAAQPAPDGLAGGRPLPDRAVLRDAVRRRRARRAARRAASGSAACSPPPAPASCGRSPPAGVTRRTRSPSGCCFTRSSRRAGDGSAWRAGWPGRRSASSPWCCSRCRCCSRSCRGGGWCRSWSARRSPSAVLLGAAAIANWHDTYTSVTSQPDSPVINHPTAWTSLAPHLASQNVAAGPFRLATIVLACLCALVIRRRWQTGCAAARPATSVPARGALADGAARRSALVGRARAGAPLVLRTGDGLVLPVAPDGGRADPRRDAELARLISAGVLAGGLTAAAQGPSHAAWIWWAPIVAGLVVLLAICRPIRHRERVPVLTPSEVRT